MAHPSFLLLNAGFFVCGFHVAFISAHFPAYVAEMCGQILPRDIAVWGREGSIETFAPATTLGAATIAIVGAANVVGTFLAGRLGAIYPKPYVLSAIYALRAVLILVFISLPVTPLTVVVFSGAMGILWLSTVPLTSGLVAAIFGPRYMATLYGIVFLSHQIGAFLGVWMGGRVYDIYGTYDLVWWFAIGLGVASALVHLPVREQSWRPRSA